MPSIFERQYTHDRPHQVIMIRTIVFVERAAYRPSVRVLHEQFDFAWGSRGATSPQSTRPLVVENRGGGDARKARVGSELTRFSVRLLHKGLSSIMCRILEFIELVCGRPIEFFRVCCQLPGIIDTANATCCPIMGPRKKASPAPAMKFSTLRVHVACEASISRREMRQSVEFSKLRTNWGEPNFLRSPQFAGGQNLVKTQRTASFLRQAFVSLLTGISLKSKHFLVKQSSCRWSLKIIWPQSSERGSETG